MSKELLELKRDLKALLKRVNAAIGCAGAGDGWEKEGEVADWIKQAVCEEWGLTVEGLVAKDKTANVALARQVVMCLCRQMTIMTLERVKEVVNRKDHATVIWAERTVKNRCETDKQFKERVDKVRAVVQQRLQQVAGAA